MENTKAGRLNDKPIENIVNVIPSYRDDTCYGKYE